MFLVFFFFLGLLLTMRASLCDAVSSVSRGKGLSSKNQYSHHCVHEFCFLESTSFETPVSDQNVFCFSIPANKFSQD